MRRILLFLPALAGCLILTAAYFSQSQDPSGETPDSPLYQVSLAATQNELLGLGGDLPLNRTGTPPQRPTCEITCDASCHTPTCGSTCRNTCHSTCARTCSQPSCRQSCGPATCEVTCLNTCETTCTSTCNQPTCELTCLVTCAFTCTSQLHAGSFNPPPEDDGYEAEPNH